MSCCVDYDPVSVFNEHWPTARKSHKCCECSSRIDKGELYQYVTMLWDGSWSTFKTCEKCADLRDSLYEIACPAYGYLREEYQEVIRPCVKPGTHAAKLVPDYYLIEGGC